MIGLANSTPRGCSYNHEKVDFENHLPQPHTGHLAQWLSLRWVPQKHPEDSFILRHSGLTEDSVLSLLLWLSCAFDQT